MKCFGALVCLPDFGARVRRISNERERERESYKAEDVLGLGFESIWAEDRSELGRLVGSVPW